MPTQSNADSYIVFDTDNIDGIYGMVFFFFFLSLGRPKR